MLQLELSFSFDDSRLYLDVPSKTKCLNMSAAAVRLFPFCNVCAGFFISF